MKWLMYSGVVCLSWLSAGCTSANRFLQRGKQDLEAGRYEDASINLRKAIQKNPKLGEAYYELARTQLRLKQGSEAYYDLRQAVSLMAGNQEVLGAYASFCLSAYQADPHRPKALYDQITETIAKIGAKNPNSYDALRFKGYLALLDRRAEEGIANLKKANQIKPFEPDVVVSLMTALMENNRPQEAVQLGQDAIKQRKDLTGAYDLLYQHYMLAKDTSQAEAVLKTRVANNPQSVDSILQLAEHYDRLNNQAGSRAVIQNLLARRSELKQVDLSVGSYYARQGNWAESIALYEDGIKRHPEDKLLYQKTISNVLLAQGKTDDAAHMVDTILGEVPTDVEASRLHAILLMYTGKPEDVDKAITQLQSAVQTSPQDLLSQLQLARAFTVKGDLEGARRQLGQALRQNPGFVPARLLLAEIAFSAKRPQDQLSEATVVLTTQPSNARARLLQVLAYSELGRLAEARSKLTALVADEPKYTDARLELGLLDLREKKLVDAEGIFRKLYISGQGFPRSLEGLVQVLSDRGQTNEAVDLLQAEVRKASPPASLRFLLAGLAARRGMDNIVREQLLLAVQENPKSFQARAMLGDYFRRKEDLNQAIGMYTEARDLEPKNPAPYISLALCYAQVGKAAEAITSYRGALQRQPDNPELLNDFAFYLADNNGDLDEALKMAQKATQKRVSSAIIADTMGWIYLKKNMADAALSIFRNVVKKDPNNALFEYHLAAALAAKGDKAQARSVLGSALQKKPHKEDEDKIKALLANLG